MAYRYEVEVTITSAKDLKNVNWRYGPVKPYAVVWVDPKSKCTTRIDEEGDTFPYWDQTLLIPLNAPIEDSTLYIDIVHANAAEDTKPLIGSTRLHLRDVVDDIGLGAPTQRKLELKRPSGRPQGKLEIKVCVREPRYRAPDPYYAPPYGVPPPSYRDYPAPPSYGNPYAQAPPPGSRDYSAPPSYGNPYAAPPPPGPYQATPPVGYPYGGPPSGHPAYGEGSYGQQPGYGEGSYGQGYKEQKKSKYGMGTGLAVGAAAGLLGGLALAEGIDYAEDKIADEAAEKVEDDLGSDGDDF